MANIKITYGQISRRFKISPTTTWSTFESQLRSLFKIPISTPITVSYTDEDGDVITLSSDLELLEVLSPTREYDSENNGTLLKLVLTVPSDDNTEVDSDSWMFEGSAVHTKEGGRANLINDASSDDENYNNDVIYNDSESSSGEGDQINDSERNSGEGDQTNDFSEETPLIELNEEINRQVPINTPLYNHVTLTEEAEEPTFMPTISSVNTSQNEEKSQHETIGETSSSAFSPPPLFSSNSDSKQSEGQSPKVHDRGVQDPEEHEGLDSLEENFIIFTPQLQLPLFGPRFSPFSHLPFSRHTRFSHCRFSPFGGSYGRFAHWGAYRHRRQCAIKGIVKAILMMWLFFTLVKLAFIAFCPLVMIFLLWKGLSFVNNFSHRRGYCDKWRQGYHGHCCRDGESNREECDGSRNEFGHFRRTSLNQRCGACFQSPNGHNVPETDIKEKLETLKSMGFSENDKNLEELVKRYSGNMNKVIDKLLGQ